MNKCAQRLKSTDEARCASSTSIAETITAGQDESGDTTEMFRSSWRRAQVTRWLTDNGWKRDRRDGWVCPSCYLCEECRNIYESDTREENGNAPDQRHQ